MSYDNISYDKKLVALELVAEIILGMISLAGIIIFVLMINGIGVIGLVILISFCLMEIIDVILVYYTVKKDHEFIASSSLGWAS